MKKGFSTLFIVIILGITTLSLVLSLSISSFWSMRGSLDSKDSNQSKALANTCAELALEAIRSNNAYVGSNTSTLNGGVCGYTVTNTGGTTRSIVASSTVGLFIRKINITTSTFNPIAISSWLEVP